MGGLQRIKSAVLGAAVAAGDAGANPGVDLAGIDHSVKPGDDFDGYANGASRKAAVIPPDRDESFSLRNIDAWYTAFKPQPGDLLYLSPDARIRSW